MKLRGEKKYGEHSLIVRLNTSERAMLHRMAQSLKVTMSALARQLIEQAARDLGVLEKESFVPRVPAKRPPSRRMLLEHVREALLGRGLSIPARLLRQRTEPVLVTTLGWATHCEPRSRMPIWLQQLEKEGALVHMPGICADCGCTDEFACDGGCSWLDRGHTLCSSCAPPAAAAKKTGTRRG